MSRTRHHHRRYPRNISTCARWDFTDFTERRRRRGRRRDLQRGRDLHDARGYGHDEMRLDDAIARYDAWRATNLRT